MADSSVTRDGENNNVRFIAEPPFHRRWRRFKDVCRAFRFLLNGGKFRVIVDCAGFDPRIHKDAGQTLFILHDGQVIEVARLVQNAVAASLSKRLGADLTLADRNDPDAFSVKSARKPTSRAPVYGDAGKGVSRERQA